MVPMQPLATSTEHVAGRGVRESVEASVREQIRSGHSAQRDHQCRGRDAAAIDLAGKHGLGGGIQEKADYNECA
jgi:hypothetical protein